MSAADELKRKILKDMQIEAAEEFDRNFERKGFFVSGEWQQIKGCNNKGSLMMRSGKLRRSIHSEIRGNEIHFTSNEVYAALHNEGGEIVITEKMHRFFWVKYYELSGKVKQTGKGKTTKGTEKYSAQSEYYKALALKKVGSKLTIPKRQFIGEHPELDKDLTAIIEENLSDFFNQHLNDVLKAP